MLLVNAKVGVSKIHGFGLIAQEFIPKGTCVWQFQPGFDLIIGEAALSELSSAAQHSNSQFGILRLLKLQAVK